MRLTPSLAVILPAAAMSVALASPRLGPSRQQFDFAPFAPGQTAASPPKGSAFIVGQVIDGTSGKPVGGALVTMNITTITATSTGTPQTSQMPARGLPARGGPVPNAQPPNGSGGSTNTARVLADGEGRFLFHDLPSGRASLTATAPGYSPGSYGAKHPTDAARPIVLTDGQRVTDAAIRLWKMASASGTVVDESGDPLVGVTVTFLRFQNVNGVRRTVGGPNVTTDDRGAFYFSTTSGDFLVVVPATSTSTPVSAIDMFQRAITTPGQSDDMLRALTSSGAPMPTGSGFRVGTQQYQPTGGLGRNIPPVSPDGALMAYQTTYYPSALTPTQAQVITLAPGEDRSNLDLTMRLSTTARVSGVISGPDGAGGNLGVRLVVADSRDATFNANYPAANTLSEPSGAFTFMGVPSGQYELQVTRVPRMDMIINGQPPSGPAASAPTLWARVPVSVGAADVAGVTVTLRTGVRVSGRVEFDGATPRPAPERLAQGMVSVQDLDNQAQPTQPTRLTADGQFSTQGVLPGHYLVTVSAGWAGGWTLKSIVANNHDLSASPQLIEGDISGVVVTFTDHPNQIDGAVQLPTPAADSPLVVVFFPANYQSWLENGTAGRVSRLVRLDSNGHFTVTGIPAGDYSFAAIPGDLSAEWQDPKNLEAISRAATRVQIRDDDHRTIDLRPVTIR